MLDNLFSRRKGYVPPPVQGARETLSQPARNGLWNIFLQEVLRPNLLNTALPWGESATLTRMAEQLFRFLWARYFGRPIDEYPGWENMLDQIKLWFLAETGFLLSIFSK